MKEPFEEPSRSKKVIIASGLLISIFGGILLTIISIDNFKNYYHPYSFGFTFGIFGLAIGLLVSKKIKPYVILNPKMLTNYFNVSIIFSVGFIGMSLFFVQKINSISSKSKCENPVVINKEFHKGRSGRFGRIEKNILMISVDNKIHRVLCSHNYWRSISVGEKVNACVYKSLIGFDYITLPDD